MYKVGSKGARAHSMYIRLDRVQVMKRAAIQAEREGESLSRFITNLIDSYLHFVEKNRKRGGK